MVFSSPNHSAISYNRNVFIGYSVPMIITLLTLAMELTLDECATGKPRFGEENCFFAGVHARDWF